MELGLLTQVSQAFRHLHPAMAHLEVPQVKDWGEANKQKAMDSLAMLDRGLAGNAFVAGDAYTVADITAMVAIDFMKPARLAVPDDMGNVKRWYAAVSARPSAKA
jgi:glutathione S-transferase